MHNKLFTTWVILLAFLCLLWAAFFLKINYKKKHHHQNVSSSLDPDQAQRNVGPDLGPNCLQRLSADDDEDAPDEMITFKII